MRRFSIARNARGSATVEFALMALFFFGIVIVALDFGVYAQQKLKFAEAVDQGAIMAFNRRDAIDAAAIRNYIKLAAGLSSDPVVTCNGGTCVAAGAGREGEFRCVDVTTGAIAATSYSAGAACPSSSNTAGYYLTIVATKPYVPIVVPNRWLGGTMTQTAVVRLQ